MKADNGSFGTEGFVVMGIPLTVQNEKPNYTFMEQQPLRQAEERTRSGTESPIRPSASC